MRALHIKLLRDLQRLWAQALAIALVMAAGVATLILGVGAHDSLSTTRARYYEANRFGDVFSNVTRAPKSLAEDIAAIDGVCAGAGAILATGESRDDALERARRAAGAIRFDVV